MLALDVSFTSDHVSQYYENLGWMGLEKTEGPWARLLVVHYP